MTVCSRVLRGACSPPAAFAVSLLVGCGSSLWARAARAQSPPQGEGASLAGGGSVAPVAATPVTGQLSVSVGRGLRFNNPYRLSTPLGDTAESVSVAATYLDLGAAVLFGSRRFRHGFSLGGDVALQGIAQVVMTPSWLAQFGVSEVLGVQGRVGVPIVVAPDTTSGLEAALGSSLVTEHGLGALVELVGSVYFGAGTDQTSITSIPLLSLQVGLFFEHEVLP